MLRSIRLLSVAAISLMLIADSHLAFQQQQQVTPLARLQANIERITRSVNAKWGIYIKCLETGEEIAINADETMDTMSVINDSHNARSGLQLEVTQVCDGIRRAA